MAEIFDLAKERADRTPHLAGNARCLGCGHAWVAVAPLGTVWLKCPSEACGLEQGRFADPVVPAVGSLWACDCGNELFYLAPDGAHCPRCGTRQHGYEHANQP